MRRGPAAPPRRGAAGGALRPGRRARPGRRRPGAAPADHVGRAELRRGGGQVERRSVRRPRAHLPPRRGSSRGSRTEKSGAGEEDRTRSSRPPCPPSRRARPSAAVAASATAYMRGEPQAHRAPKEPSRRAAAVTARDEEAERGAESRQSSASQRCTDAGTTRRARPQHGPGEADQEADHDPQRAEQVDARPRDSGCAGRRHRPRPWRRSDGSPTFAATSASRVMSGSFTEET